MKNPGPPKKQFWLKNNRSADFDFNLKFTAGRDVQTLPMADEEILEADIYTNLAHILMLKQQNIISNQEHMQIKQGLISLLNDFKAGRYHLDPGLEDVHMNIENHLINKLKIKAASKIHTARSRNDQVATDMRLHLRGCLVTLAEDIIKLASTLKILAQQHIYTIMPGFTHYQPAMFTSLGHLISGWLQAEIRSIRRIQNCLDMFNTCPLGAGAGYGSSWNIDPSMTAKSLGFKVSLNSLDALSSRSEFETQIAADIAIISSNWSKIAQDLILFSHPYYGFIKIPPDYVTGSSIMPQKNNPDFAELIRAKASFAQGSLQSILSTIKALPSGYNRDIQQTKYIILDLIREIKHIPKILNKVMGNIIVNKKACLDKCLTGDMQAIEITNLLTNKLNLGFREAYAIVTKAISQNKGQLDIKEIIKNIKLLKNNIEISQKEWHNVTSPEIGVSNRKHIGAPSPKAVLRTLKENDKQIIALDVKLSSFKSAYQKSLSNLL